MSKPKVGLQLIVYGPRPRTDLEGVFAEVASAGYVGVEAGNLFKQAEPKKIKELFAKNGLQLTGTHGGYNEVASEASLEENIAYLLEMKSRYLICSGVAPGQGIAAYETAAETFNKVGERCKKDGLIFCYHNHAGEFQSFNGVKGMHRLCELTDPKLMQLCIDVYWVHIGGESPAEFIKRYSSRAPYYHFKDGGKGYFIELGQGEVDLKAAFKAALDTNPDWIVCEQDRTDKEPKQSIIESRQYLKELGI
jgi:sugar phosphate isomerase/epimerase